jgi:HK97 family phage major capsid protein
MSILPVSAETINLGSVNLDTELPLIFAEAFADCFAKQVLTGDGTGMNFDGIFNNLENTIDCVSTGNPKIADLVNLAVKISDFADDCVIILHPSVYAGILADDTPGVSIFYKELLIKEKTIEGVIILTTGYAPSSVSSGSTVAVAGKMDNYAMAIASQILIEPVKRVGDSNTYFTATLFANGCKIINKNFIGLQTK